jgi:hypothetical protein
MAPVNAVLAPPPPVSASQLEVQKRNLRRCNWAAAGFHFASFIAAITVGLVFLSDSAQVALTTDFLVYDANATVSTGGTAPDQAGPFSQACKVLGYYQVIWLVEFEPLITSIFHAVIAGVPSVNAWYNDNVLRLGRNPIRWYEYSITATPMIWVIAALSGVTNIVWLVVLALGNVVLQFTGYLMEEMNREPRITKKRKPVRWTPTLLGWILFLAQWIPVFVYFFAAITSERPPDVEMVPAFVYVTVFALFFWFSLFGLLMTLHYLGWPAFLRPLYNNEVGYVSLSFLAKFTITWSILIGTATNMRASV